MDKLCQYSTIIFAGNVTVLCIVAVTTDYWEYRGFNSTKIVPELQNSNRTKVIFPTDTNTYIEIHYKRRWNDKDPCFENNKTLYQPPAYTKHFSCICNTNRTCDENVPPYLASRYDIIYLFTQYGNLFRECDNLEAGVRLRLGIDVERKSRCWTFISDEGQTYFDVPALKHLERASFLCAMVCVIGMTISLILGAYGSLTRIRGSVVTASYASLVSGILLTFSIAIFHGKCYLLQRRDFMDGKDIPFKSILSNARTFSFGWSFVVSWICVLLCFVESWIWLHKAQHMKEKQEMKDALMEKEEQVSERPGRESFYSITYLDDT